MQITTIIANTCSKKTTRGVSFTALMYYRKSFPLSCWTKNTDYFCADFYWRLSFARPQGTSMQEIFFSLSVYLKTCFWRGPEDIVSVVTALQYFSCKPAISCLDRNQRSIGTDLYAAVTPDALIIIKPQLFLFNCYSPGRTVLPAFAA